MELQNTLAAKARSLLISNSSTSAKHATLKVLDEWAGERDSAVDWKQESEIESSAEAQLIGYGVLNDYLADDEIEELWINQPNEIFYCRDGRVYRDAVNLSTEQLQTFVHRMLRTANRRIDRLSPFSDSALQDGSRLHVVIPDVTAQHWAVNLRKFRKGFRQLDTLANNGMLTQSQAAFLAQQVIEGKNLLISGPTQAGKTTLLSALLGTLPESTRLVTCEETFEIKCNLNDWVAMQTRQANIEGHGEIPLRRLVKEALRMRPDRLVIGEVREAESLDLLIAMNSGLPGICTIHANSAQSALQKLATLPLLAGPNITSEFVTATIGASLDFVVQLSVASGVRKVKEICSVVLGQSGLTARPVKL